MIQSIVMRCLHWLGLEVWPVAEVLIPLQSDATMVSIQSGIEEHGWLDLGWNTGDPRMRLSWSERVMDRAEAMRILLTELDKHNIRPVTSEGPSMRGVS